jgi:nucleoside-diphosphate-sugar epimerase
MRKVLIVDHFRRRASAIEWGNPDVGRHFPNVRTVVGGCARLLDAQGTGEVHNVCSGRTHCLNEVRGSNAKLEAAIGPRDRIPLSRTLRWMYRA